jgi:hypothetical protein
MPAATGSSQQPDVVLRRAKARRAQDQVRTAEGQRQRESTRTKRTCLARHDGALSCRRAKEAWAFGSTLFRSAAEWALVVVRGASSRRIRSIVSATGSRSPGEGGDLGAPEKLFRTTGFSSRTFARRRGLSRGCRAGTREEGARPLSRTAPLVDVASVRLRVPCLAEWFRVGGNASSTDGKCLESFKYRISDLSAGRLAFHCMWFPHRQIYGLSQNERWFLGTQRAAP